MRILPSSGIEQLEDGVEYAVVYLDQVGYRPVKMVPRGETFVMSDPDSDADEVLLVDDDSNFQVVGRWDDRVVTGGSMDATWRQYAAYQFGQVLRHNELVERLARFGIVRAREYYLRFRNGPAIERDLTLNYDELDRLLSAAERSLDTAPGTS